MILRFVRCSRSSRLLQSDEMVHVETSDETWVEMSDGTSVVILSERNDEILMMKT